jgi:hypothetical protein
MNKTMKSILGAAIVGMSCMSFNAFAIPIGSNGGEVIKVAWGGRTDANSHINWTRNGSNGGSSGGGISRWVLQDDAANGITVEDAIDLGYGWLTDAEFYAMCMEPYQGLSSGWFEIVDLRFSPTSPENMQESTARRLELIVSGGNDAFGWTLMNDLRVANGGNKAQVTALQMAVWEAGQEDANGNPGKYDRNDGNFTDVISTNAGANALITSLEGFGGDDVIKGFGLLAVAPDGNDGWQDRRRQDFFVFEYDDSGGTTQQSVPVPAPMALMGLGLVGMIGARKLKNAKG